MLLDKIPTHVILQVKFHEKKQPKVVKHIKGAPKCFPVSIIDFHFSNMDKRQNYSLFNKPLCCFEKKCSIIFV